MEVHVFNAAKEKFGKYTNVRNVDDRCDWIELGYKIYRILNVDILIDISCR